MAITLQDIHACADQIAAVGATPTLAAVRRALGGGSFTTISEAMQEWKASRQAAAVPVPDPAPVAVTDRMAAAALEIWAIAREVANARLQGEREAIERARSDMETARAEAAELADQLGTELEAAQAIIGQQHEALRLAEEDARHRAKEGLEQAAQLARQHEATHTGIAALDEAHSRIEQLSELLEREQVARADAQAAYGKLVADAAVLAEKLEAMTGRATKAEAQAGSAARDLASANIAIQAGQARLESAARELDDARKLVKEARADAKKSGEDAAELRGQLSMVRQSEVKPAESSAKK